MTNNTAVAATTPAGQPASSANVVQATAATTPAMDAPTPLIAETANNAGTPATTIPAALPASDMWLRRMGRATERSAQWLQAPRTCSIHAIWERHPPAQPAQDGEPGEPTQRRYPSATCYTLC
eukprot:7898166-Pyramimonas_sp.AAC.1